MFSLQKTGFSQEDAEVLKEALKTLFENDASSARPKEAWKFARCIGGSTMKRHQLFLVEKFREALILSKRKIVQRNLRIMKLLGM